MKEVLKVNNVVGQIKLIKMTKSNNLTTTAKNTKDIILLSKLVTFMIRIVESFL